MGRAEFDLAQQCLHEANDHGGLLLLATAAGNADMVEKLGSAAEDGGKNNVSFLSYFLSEISRVVGLWRTQLGKVNEKAGQSLADPADYPNLFPNYEKSLQAEKMLRKERSQQIPARDFSEILPNHERKPLEELNAVKDEENIDENLDEKDHPVGSGAPVDSITDDLEAELEMDLDNLKLDDIDTTDVNLDDEGLLED